MAVFRTVVTVLAIFAAIRPATASGLVETYLKGFEDRYSVDFVETAYCAAIVFDTASHLGQLGIQEGNDELVEISQAIVKQQRDLIDQTYEKFFNEINPQFVEVPDDEMTDQAWESGSSAIEVALGTVMSGEQYDFIWSYISYFEWLGLYAYCSEVYLERGLLKKDVSIKAILDTEHGSGAFFKPAVEWTIEAGQAVIDWTKTNYTTVSSLDVCDGELDLLGGAAIGTAATSVLAGESVLVVIGSSSVLIATAPAIATGVTISALAGSTLFLTAKGYCYLAT